MSVSLLVSSLIPVFYMKNKSASIDNRGRFLYGHTSKALIAACSYPLSIFTLYTFGILLCIMFPIHFFWGVYETVYTHYILIYGHYLSSKIRVIPMKAGSRGAIRPETAEVSSTAAPCTRDGGYDEVIYCGRCGEEISRVHHTTAEENEGKYNSDGVGRFVLSCLEKADEEQHPRCLGRYSGSDRICGLRRACRERTDAAAAHRAGRDCI